MLKDVFFTQSNNYCYNIVLISEDVVKIITVCKRGSCCYAIDTL